MSVMLRMLASKLSVDKDAARLHLESQLRSLSQEVESARKSLADGSRLNEHLIVNASGLSALIARWNMLLDLGPYMDKEER